MFINVFMALEWSKILWSQRRPLNSNFQSKNYFFLRNQKGVKYLDSPSCETRVVDLRSYYDDVPAALDLSDPPCPDDNTDFPWLQKNGVDKWMNGTDRNWMSTIWYIANVLYWFDFWYLNLTWNRTEKEKMIQLKFDVHFMVVMLMFMNKLNGME